MMKCRLLRFRIGAALDADRPLSVRLARHLEQCPECAAWCRAQQNLAGRLRQAVPLAETPPFLQARILGAIGNSRPQPEASYWMWRAGAVAAAVVGTMLAIQMQQQGRQKGLADPGPGSASVAPAAMLSSSSPYFSGGSRWLQSAIVMDQPLRREITLLKEDGLNTLRALKAGFVPNLILPEND